MKLAEALSVRKGLMDRISVLRQRIEAGVKVQEGTQVAEPVDCIVKELDQTLCDLENLIYRINVTNSQTFDNGLSITFLLAQRDALRLKVNALNSAMRRINDTDTRYGRNEIKNEITVDAAEFRKMTDREASRLRQLELRIQGLGWTNDLCEI